MMVRLGLKLSLRSGREALIRLVLIASAVAVGVTVLLSVLADLHAFSATNNRPCWECTQANPPTRGAPAPNAELWNYSRDFYQGHPIERLDVAALGSQAPVIPGLSRMPGAGQYYASPALAKLLDSVPADELGDRFPGSRAGVIGDAALSGPNELAIVIGYTPARLAAMPATGEITAIATKPQVNSTTGVYQYGFGLATIGLVVPLLILIGTATRLAAARREERLAALRLVGATSRQISVIASVDALAGALIGSVAGIGLFQLVRPAVADVAITGSRYFTSAVTPTTAEYVAVLIGVPVAAVGAALASLRRVRISPLGVGRKTMPADPRAWRVIPLLVGLVLFIVPAVAGGSKPKPPAPPSHAALPFIFLGLILIMIGLVVGGSWLTMRAARLAAGTARGASALLAARRLADNPKAAFRSISGLVLAVFVGTAIAGAVPGLLSVQQGVGGGTLTKMLRASFTPEAAGCAGDCGAAPSEAIPKPGSATAGGLPPQTAAGLLGRLRSFTGVAALPLYLPSAKDEQVNPPPGPGGQPQGGPGGPQGDGGSGIVSCQSLQRFAALGRCAPGVRAVGAGFFTGLLSTDNLLALQNQLPVVDHSSQAVSDNLATLRLGGMLITTDSPATLERVRTLLAGYSAAAGAVDPPQTFGEVGHTRGALFQEAEQITLVVVALTLLVAGCSLAVAVGGGLIERKRPFTLLRLTGTSTPILYRVVLLESALPLLLAAVVAACAGFVVAIPVVDQLSTTGSSVEFPGQVYFLTMGGGVVASLMVVLAALPLLKRITEPNNARFE